MCRKKKRIINKTRTDIESFLWAYADAIRDRMTRQEFADSMGVRPDTIYQRVYELQCEGHDLPQLPVRKPLSRQEIIRKTLKEIRKVVSI